MPIEVTATAYGPDAFDALAAAVRRVKHGDPLVPMSVIVPTNTAGVMARRALGRRGGATAIDVLTLFRAAEVLGSPTLLAGGRKPVSTPVVDLAVKQVLARSPGLYGPVHRHPSTVVALRDLYRELRVAGPTALTALARTGRGNEPARVAAEVARLLAPSWYDEGDLLAAAASAARRQLPDRLARVVVHLPERLRPLERQLLRALATTADVELIVGMTGDPEADEPIHALVADLTEASIPAAPVPQSGLIDVVSTTDADDEVRLAVRAVVDGARRGTRFDRMAVLWPTRRPYARMVEHQLTAAGIPWNGRPGTGTDERMVPRLLADLLELDRRGLRRSALMALLGDVPARDSDGRPVPSARWERIGRRAGIVRDADWEARLAEAIADAADRGPNEVAAAASLMSFVDDLRSALGSPSDVRRWSDWVAWSHERLDWWFGRRGLDRLEGVERDAWERTQLVLSRLGHLDSIGPPVTRPEFRATFVAELEVAPARHGKVGDGVHVGALSGAGGLDVDLVVIVGAADGLLPPPPEVDPLLGDSERVAAGLVGSEERVTVAHRQFLAAVGTTPISLVTIPRGDLRAAADNQPSRWLEARAGRTVIRSWTTVHSHAHALASTEFPVSEAEHRRRHLWTHVRAGGDVRDFAVSDPILGRGLRLRDARAGDVLSEYDGDLSSRPIPRMTGPVSATRIELWPRCPHAYFVRYVLGVRPVDEPEEIEALSPLDRGSAMHAAIDRLQQEVLAGRLPDPSPHGWTDVHREALSRIGTAVADELEAGGRTGRDASWANERAALLAELDRWMDADTEQWRGRRIVHSELRFGDDGEVRLTLSDGRPLSFAGQIDRIDELPDGTLVVTDHKTGRADSLGKLSADAPTMGATRFQLPVYAAAAVQALGRPGNPVRAEYSFFEKGDFKRIGYTLDEHIWAQVGHDLALVVDGIESGFFPARAEPPAWRPFVDCEYCEPDGLGTAVRWSEWDRKRHDPRLARWFADPDEVESTAAANGASSCS